MDESDTIYQWRRVYARKNKSKLCPTLTANMGTGGHNVPLIKDEHDIRKLTPKECLLFQGFPQDFKIPNISDSHIYKQAGNAVSVPVIKRIAENIIKTLNTDKEIEFNTYEKEKSIFSNMCMINEEVSNYGSNL